jgi:hypothetical protein
MLSLASDFFLRVLYKVTFFFSNFTWNLECGVSIQD